MGRELVLGVSHAPPQQGEAPALPDLGFPSIYAYTLRCRTSKFDVAERVCIGVSHTSHTKTAEFQGSPILGVSCICAYTFNAERPNWAW